MSDDKTHKIVIECNPSAKEDLEPLLAELMAMGDNGNTRSIYIEDWGENNRFEFDGDGPSRILNLETDGEKVARRKVAIRCALRDLAEQRPHLQKYVDQTLKSLKSFDVVEVGKISGNQEQGDWLGGDIWVSKIPSSDVVKLVKQHKQRIDNTCPALGCIDKSYAWAEVFSEHDIWGEVVSGAYIDVSPEGRDEYYDEIMHTWIELSSGIFFDPTAKQFRFPPRQGGYREGTIFDRYDIAYYDDWIEWV